MDIPKVTLEQWRAFHGVVEFGGYAQAAEKLNKTQSTLSYSVQKLEQVLGIKVFTVEGRRSHLTKAGEVLLRRSKPLLENAVLLERVAQDLAQGVEAKVNVAVDVLFPHDRLLDLLAQFSAGFPDTRVELMETVLSGGMELMLSGKVDVLVSHAVPQGFVGEPLMTVELICVANPDHPLHQLQRDVTLHDLKQHRQMVIRDSGEQRSLNAPWLEAEQRWTVSHITTSIRAIAKGLGFAWVPKLQITEELQTGVIKPLPLEQGRSRFVQLYLVYRDKDAAGPATRYLSQLLNEV